MLDHGDVVSYLLQRGLLHARSVVDGTLVVRDMSSRNRDFALDGGGNAQSYFLKQGMDPDGAATVLHEATVYTLFSAPECAMARYIRMFHPRFRSGVGQRIPFEHIFNGDRRNDPLLLV